MGEVKHKIVMYAEKMSKIYPGTIALNEVDFQIHEKAVNVLIGENGAGKSTLMKILAGVEQPTSGKMTLDHAEVRFESISDAADHGIGIVFQELNLCPNLTVTENIFLGRDIVKAGIHIDVKAQTNRAKELLDLLEHDIDPNVKVSELKIGEQQIVEIAKALADDAKILIMDEPTSALSNSEVEVLFKVINELTLKGVAIIYISHRLDELIRIGDYFTVLRDGELVANAPKDKVSIPWIIENMLGSETINTRSVNETEPGEVVLSAKNVCLLREGGVHEVDHVSLDLKAGEVTVIYGLLGSGRTEFFESLYGLRSDATGSVKLLGKELIGMSVTNRINEGLLLVPEDRQRDGLVQTLSVGLNLGLASMSRFTKYFSISKKQENPILTSMVNAIRIKTPHIDAPITSLSGGNQQKVVIGKTLLTQPKLLMLDEPSRGIDIGAKAEVFNVMRELAEQGLAIVYATSDLKETHKIADRVLVMSFGKITADLTAREATDEMIVNACTAQ